MRYEGSSMRYGQRMDLTIGTLPARAATMSLYQIVQSTSLLQVSRMRKCRGLEMPFTIGM